jgi:hypothetical protein
MKRAESPQGEGSDGFKGRLEAALESESGREDFLTYLQGLTPRERVELFAEADRRDTESINL